MNVVTINGKTIITEGKSISVNGNTVYVDGRPVSEELSGIVEIKVEGDLMNLSSGVSVSVAGDIHGDVRAGTSINAGLIDAETVRAGTSINCTTINGNAKAGTSIKCNVINK